MANFQLKKRDSANNGGIDKQRRSQMFLRCALTRKKDAAKMADFRYARDTTKNDIDLYTATLGLFRVEQLTSGVPGSRDELSWLFRYPLDALDRSWMVWMKQVGQLEENLGRFQ